MLADPLTQWSKQAKEQLENSEVNEVIRQEDKQTGQNDELYKVILKFKNTASTHLCVCVCVCVCVLFLLLLTCF